MARPRQEPHALYRADRGRWVIVDGRTRVPIDPPLTSPGPVDEAAARLAVARYVVEQAAKTVAVPRTDRDLTEVSIAEVLERYLARRTDPDPAVRKKTVARPRELEQRIGRLVEFWGDMTVAGITEATCEGFAEHCGSSSYARRCLGDLQSALNEGRRAALFRTPVLVSMPPPPDPREDHLTVAEAIALVRVCWRKRDTQQRRVGGKIVMVDGRRTLVGGVLKTVVGSKRPWWHVGKFVAVAIATCSRSSRIYEASYAPEPGRPWMDLERGVLHRQPPGARKTKKRAPTVDVADRLVAAMRRWSSDRVVAGQTVTGDRYVVQWAGKPADPKGAFVEAVEAARLEYPTLFLRDDGTPKQVVRHTLRHTGVTWLSESPDVDVEDICSYAGMSRAMYDRVYGHAHKARSKKVKAAQARKKR